MYFIQRKHLIFVTLLFLLSGCVVEFNGSRTSNENQFILDVKMMNQEENHELFLKDGDMIEVNSDVSKGEMRVSIIHDETNESIYEGNLKGDFKFIITVHSNGKYTINVNGKNAAGYIEFKKIEKK